MEIRSMSRISKNGLSASEIYSEGAALHYSLLCRQCGSEIEYDGYRLSCPYEGCRGLLTTLYAEGRLFPDPNRTGFTRYWRWLPTRNNVCWPGHSVTYQSKRLSKIVGLPQLWVSFHGYWPQRGATLETCTFKDLEAHAVLSRIPQDSTRVLVVASAGNTAAA